MPVSNLAIDRDNHLINTGVNHVHGFLPARGVLSQHESRQSAMDFVGRIAACDLNNLGHRAACSLRVHAHRDSRSQCLERIGQIGAPRQ